jgi:subtilisin family serine protease
MQPPTEYGGAHEAVEARNYDPTPPPPDIMRRHRARVLDPDSAEQVAGITVRSTVYVADRLLVPTSTDLDDAVRMLTEVAGSFGLSPSVREGVGHALPHGVTIVGFQPRGDEPARPPDAWSILQWARSRFGLEPVARMGLDHVMVANGRVMAVPFQPQYRPAAPASAPTAPGPPVPVPVPAASAIPAPEDARIADYVHQGGGGRQPVAWLGPPPQRRPDFRGRRPVVAILDTGCGSHPWLDPVVDSRPRLDGADVGKAAPGRDPEAVGSMDDFEDAVAGHGTFMAGLVRLSCPDADLISVRTVGHDGVVVESDLVGTLAHIIELVRRDRDGEPGGRAVDVLVLSMGYYHETAETDPFEPILTASLEALGRLGVTVVAAAGNDATSRPMYPAAFAPWSNLGGLTTTSADRLPVISVGATNPDGAVALFSNDGPWVRAWEAGAAVVSTMPVTFHGGMTPAARRPGPGQVRSRLDPDDYSAGFAVWSGTSFAAPVLAGKLAHALGEGLESGRGPEDAVTRGWAAVEACTRIQR